MISHTVSGSYLAVFVSQFNISDMSGIVPGINAKLQAYAQEVQESGEYLDFHTDYFELLSRFLNEHNLMRNMFWLKATEFIAWEAISNDDLAMTKYLFECILGGEDLGDLENYRQRLLQQALISSCQRNSAEIMTYLISIGADIYENDDEALRVAENHDSKNCLAMLKSINRFMEETSSETSNLKFIEMVSDQHACVSKQVFELRGEKYVLHICKDFAIQKTEYCDSESEVFEMIGVG